MLLSIDFLLGVFNSVVNSSQCKLYTILYQSAGKRPKGPRVSRPRPRRGRGRLKESDACQRYYMFFTVQPKISIFMAQFKYLNDDQNASKSPWTFIHAISTSCEKIREIYQSGEKLRVVEILQKWGVCVKNGYDSPETFFVLNLTLVWTAITSVLK